MRVVGIMLGAFLAFILTWTVLVGGFGWCVHTYIYTRDAIEEMHK